MDILRIDFTNTAGPQISDKMKTDKAFSQIFDIKIAQADKAIAANKATGPETHEGNFDVIKHGNKILNLLDDYANQLQDPAKNLNHLGNLVQTIEKETSLMKTNISDKVQGKKGLEKFVKDLTVTANVAAFKFHRGDYA